MECNGELKSMFYLHREEFYTSATVDFNIFIITSTLPNLLLKGLIPCTSHVTTTTVTNNNNPGKRKAEKSRVNRVWVRESWLF